jgi:hypothetical protein
MISIRPHHAGNENILVWTYIIMFFAYLSMVTPPPHALPYTYIGAEESVRFISTLFQFTGAERDIL